MFKVVDKVVCIDDKNQKYPSLIEGKIYIIRGIYEYKGYIHICVEGIVLDNIISLGKERGHNPNRFRKLNDTWVDELLCKLIEEVKVDEFVSA